MKYQVVRIDEDIDFGCEERSADEPVMAVVVLKDENGTESRIRQEDQMLYDWNIEEGDTVILNENGELRKVLSGDWTQNCNSKNVDTTKFVNMMQAVKAGKQIDWICPFCSGTVERLEQRFAAEDAQISVFLSSGKDSTMTEKQKQECSEVETMLQGTPKQNVLISFDGKPPKTLEELEKEQKRQKKKHKDRGEAR